MRLGVVVVSYNVGELLVDCLRSLDAELESCGLSSQVWVVDNASSDESVELVRSRHPSVSLVTLSENRGFAAANNVVLETWASDPERCPDLVLLLNPDTELQPGSLQSLVAAIAAAGDVGLVGPKLVHTDGRLQHSAFRFPGVQQVLLDMFPVARLADTTVNGRYPESLYAAGEPFEVDLVLGACMLVRGAALVEVGTLDEGFRMYCEEIDWCMRFRDSGYRVVCVPESVVVHHAGASTSQRPLEMYIELWRSRLKLYRKHEPPHRRRLLAAIIQLGLLAHRLWDRWMAVRGELPPDQRDRRSEAYSAIVREVRE